jgi:hypothetical protein
MSNRDNERAFAEIVRMASSEHMEEAAMHALERRLATITAGYRRPAWRMPALAAATLFLLGGGWWYWQVIEVEPKAATEMKMADAPQLLHLQWKKDNRERDEIRKSLAELIEEADVIIAGEIIADVEHADKSLCHIERVLKGVPTADLSLPNHPDVVCPEPPDFLSHRGWYSVLFVSDGRVWSAQRMMNFPTRDECLEFCAWIDRYRDGTVAPTLAALLMPEKRRPWSQRRTPWDDFLAPDRLETDLAILKDPAAVDNLLAFLACPADRHIESIRASMGPQKDEEAIKPYVRQLRDFDIAGAINALAAIGDPKPIPILRAIASDEKCSPHVRDSATRALAQFAASITDSP